MENMNRRDLVIRNLIISIFITLYCMVSLVSTVHTIDFFLLTNPRWLAISLAVAFEVGAMASLAAIIILDKTSRALVWFLFLLLTLMQCMGNAYFSYAHAHDFQNWMELFSLNEEEPIYQKRILAIISGAILPIVALGFIKSLVDYIRPENAKEISAHVENNKVVESNQPIVDKIEETEVIEHVKPETTKKIIEDIDEDAILSEAINSSKETESIETIKNDSIKDTLDIVEDITKIEESVPQKIEPVIKPTKDNVNTERSNIWPGQKTHVREEAGTGGQSRSFGPPHINNGTIQ